MQGLKISRPEKITKNKYVIYIGIPKNAHERAIWSEYVAFVGRFFFGDNDYMIFYEDTDLIVSYIAPKNTTAKKLMLMIKTRRLVNIYGATVLIQCFDTQEKQPKKRTLKYMAAIPKRKYKKVKVNGRV